MYFFRINYREVTFHTGNYTVRINGPVFLERDIGLCDQFLFLFFGRKVYRLILEIDLTIFNLAIRSLNKSEVVHLGIN